jgi:hypothetical protein
MKLFIEWNAPSNPTATIAPPLAKNLRPTCPFFHLSGTIKFDYLAFFPRNSAVPHRPLADPCHMEPNREMYLLCRQPNAFITRRNNKMLSTDFMDAPYRANT